MATDFPAWAQWSGWLPAGTALLLALFASYRLARNAWRARSRSGGASGQQTQLRMLRDLRRDPLTGLLSRQGFDDALAARLEGGRPAALLVIDLDKFAAINKQYGHRAGDEVLSAAADRLRALVPAGQQLARLGADQFAVLMDAADGEDAVEAAALRMARAMMAPLRVGVEALACSVSLGIAISPVHGAEPDALLQAALTVLGQVKAGGGAAWRIFDPAQQAAFRQRASLGRDLRAAMQAAQIVPHYQPIIDLQTGEIAGLEVLARWAHPSLGLLQPAAFIPLAEELQLAGQISALLMRRVIADSRDWPPHLYFAFNTSPGQLRELIGLIRDPPHWPEGVLDPNRIEVEITGSAVIEDVDVAREVMALLQERGTRVVLDDFGTGTPNFQHMRELRFDRLKIDTSFVIGVEGNERAQACVRAMAGLSDGLGVTIAAEGIETAAAEAFLTGLGCRFGQGFFYSEAVPAEDVRGLLLRFRVMSQQRRRAHA